MPNRHGRRAAAHLTSNSTHARRSSFTRFVRGRPLLVVGAGVILGMALGALLPWSRIEDELLGDQAEKLKDGALELASDGYEKAKAVAQRSYQAATEMVRGNEINTDTVQPAIQADDTEASATDQYHH